MAADSVLNPQGVTIEPLDPGKHNLKAVILDATEDGGQEIAAKRRAFHEAMGFRSLPSRPSRMFIPIETVRNART